MEQTIADITREMFDELWQIETACYDDDGCLFVALSKAVDVAMARFRGIKTLNGLSCNGKRFTRDGIFVVGRKILILAWFSKIRTGRMEWPGQKERA